MVTGQLISDVSLGTGRKLTLLRFYVSLPFLPNILALIILWYECKGFLFLVKGKGNIKHIFTHLISIMPNETDARIQQ